MTSSGELNSIKDAFHDAISTQYNDVISSFGANIWEGESHDNLLKNADVIVEKYDKTTNQLGNFASAIDAALEYDKAYSEKETAKSNYHRQLSNFNNGYSTSCPTEPDYSFYNKRMSDAENIIVSLLSGITEIQRPVVSSPNASANSASSTSSFSGDLLSAIMNNQDFRYKGKNGVNTQVLGNYYSSSEVYQRLNDATVGKSGFDRALASAYTFLDMGASKGFYLSHTPSGHGATTTDFLINNAFDCQQAALWFVNQGSSTQYSTFKSITSKCKTSSISNAKPGDIIQNGNYHAMIYLDTLPNGNILVFNASDYLCVQEQNRSFINNCKVYDAQWCYS